MNPLPLTDGAFFVDNSTLELLQCCPRSFEYAKIYKRVSASPKASLSFGTSIHNALEIRYRDFPNTSPTDECFSAQCRAIESHFAAHPVPDEEPRNANWSIEIIRKYNEIYHTEPFNLLIGADGKPLVELSFALPLATINSIPIVYIGRIDLPVHWDKGLWILDHKTTSMLGNSYFEAAQMSAQQIGYCWAFEQLTGKTISGFCINAIRTSQIPAKPKNGIEAWWREALQRQRYPVTPEQITEWKANVINLIRTMFFHHSSEVFPQQTTWCVGKYGKCQYFGVCSYPADKRAMLLADDNAFTDNIWSPLK